MFVYKEYMKEIVFFFVVKFNFVRIIKFFLESENRMDFYFDFDLWLGMNKIYNLKYGLFELDFN